MVKKIILFIFSFIISSSIFANSITATVQKQKIAMNEPFVLTLSVEQATMHEKPDLSALNKDFKILGQARSSRISIINGERKASSHWQIQLLPKHAGDLTIPPITIGHENTQPIKINVTKANKPVLAKIAGSQNTAKTENGPGIFLESSVTPDNLYVQGQAIYTLKIYFDRNIQRPQLIDPQSDNALLMHIDNDKNYPKEVNGKKYLVLERQYALFPQKSGELTLSAPVLTGDILMRDQAGLDDNLFQQMGWRPVRLAGKALTLKVKPVPVGLNSNWWLPAKNVKLHETWSQNPPKFHVGEPITRTITLKATGLSANQLPQIDVPTPPGFQTYPDKAALKTTSEDGNIIGVRREHIAMIPNQTGTVTLPEIRVSWWDTKENKQQAAVIPAQTIKVLPALGQAGSAATIQPMNLAKKSKLVATMSSDNSGASHLWIGLSALLAVGWLATLGYFFYQKKYRKITKINKPIEQPEQSSLRQIRVDLKQASKNQQASLTAEKLIQYAKKYWPEAKITNLADIKFYIKDTKAKELLTQLEQNLYASNTCAWSHEEFWPIIQKAMSKTTKEITKQELRPPMYPTDRTDEINHKHE